MTVEVFEVVPMISDQPIPPLNRELLARLRDRIAEVGSEHCNMHAWTYGEMVGEGEPECGTTACIGGHALAIHYGSFAIQVRPSDVIHPMYLLGVGNSLFHLTFWPSHYAKIASTEGHAKGMVSILDAILDGFIDPHTLLPT